MKNNKKKKENIERNQKDDMQKQLKCLLVD